MSKNPKPGIKSRIRQFFCGAPELAQAHRNAMDQTSRSFLEELMAIQKERERMPVVMNAPIPAGIYCAEIREVSRHIIKPDPDRPRNPSGRIALQIYALEDGTKCTLSKNKIGAYFSGTDSAMALVMMRRSTYVGTKVMIQVDIKEDHRSTPSYPDLVVQVNTCKILWIRDVPKLRNPKGELLPEGSYEATIGFTSVKPIGKKQKARKAKKNRKP